MKNPFVHISKHVTRHAKNLHSHLKKHHKKYLFGVFGGFAVVKLFLLMLGFSVVQYTSTSTFADLASGCVLTGEYYTGEYEEGGYLTGQTVTPEYTTGCVTVPGYWTEGTLDEFGVLTGQTRVEESQEGCTVVPESISEGYMEGSYLTGGYRTGGYEICDEEQGTGDEGQGTGDEETLTGDEETLTGDEETLTGDEETLTGDDEQGTGVEEILSNGVCESGDIVWNAPLSGSIVRDIFDLSWSYSGTDCLLSGLSLQIFDHNSQWIDLGTLASGTTSASFDSQRLYSFQHSGYYHIIGTGGSGEQIYLYTGTYTGLYSHFSTGYKARLLTPDQTAFYESSLFTIDNEYPTLSGIALLADEVSSGTLTSGTVTLSFTASELLSGIVVTLGSGTLPTSSVASGLVYSSTRNLSGYTVSGALATTINFADIAGNTGTTVYTSSLSFIPTSGTLLTGTLTGETNTLKKEVEKFIACKSGLIYSPIEIEVRHNTFVLQMPAFKKSQVKTLVNAFTLFVLDKVKKDYKINSDDITDITKKFDNFLIILKLLRDDDNDCKQNLSNYYVNQFRQALKEYKISLD